MDVVKIEQKTLEEMTQTKEVVHGISLLLFLNRGQLCFLRC